MDPPHDFKSLDRSVRKQRIIDTAAMLFHHRGYSATTLDDVSGELGISKAALYHYVKSKDELLSIIYTQAFENIFRDTYEISGMDLPPDEKLRRVIRNHIKNIIIKDLSMFSVFFSEESRLPVKDFVKIREEKRRYTRIIEEIMEEGIRQGVFREADTRLQAYAILGMCNWIYKWYKMDTTAYAPEEIADHFIDLLQSGYLPAHEDVPDRRPPRRGRGRAEKNKSRKAVYAELKRQSRTLVKLVEELGE